MALSLVTRLRAWPVLAAACWVMVELGYSRIPFGGFGWTRIAYAAVDTPLAGYLPVIGVTGVSFVLALVGQLLAWVALAAFREPRRRVVRILPALAAAAGLVVLGAGMSLFQVEPAAGSQGSVGVGVVQGNVPGRGIEALGRARSVTNNHLSETVDLMTRARLGQVPTPDFLLWPENSTDIDPTLDPITRYTVAGCGGGWRVCPSSSARSPRVPAPTNDRPRPCGGTPSVGYRRPTTSRTWCPSASGSRSGTSCSRSCRS